MKAPFFFFHLNQTRQKKSRNVIIGALNMNSFLNKFDQLKLLCKNTIDVLLVLTETKLDDSFSSCQFHIEDCSILQREDKNDNGGGVWY